MTRAFYPASRRHHAYAMMIDFGMKFRTRNGFWTPEGLLGVTGAGGYRIEVAEESMPLLEPNPATDLTEEKVLELLKGVPVGRERKHIIHRNGIPFHMPDFES